MSIIFCLYSILVLRQKGEVLAIENTGNPEDSNHETKYGGKYFAIAKEIADLVSGSLEHRINKLKNGEGNELNKQSKPMDSGNVASAFLHLLGLDSTRIAAMAVNSAIFLAHVISSLFNITTKHQNISAEEQRNNFNALEFIMNSKNPKLHSLVTQAQNPGLLEQLIDEVDGLDSQCIKLLLCKTSPILSAVQGSLHNPFIIRRFDFTSWLPKPEIFENTGDACERQYHNCNVFPEILQNSYE